MLTNFLAYVMFVPIAIGIFCLFLSERSRIITRILAFLTTLAVLAASIRIFIFKPLYWPPVPVPPFIVDNLAALTGIGIAFFAFLIVIYSFGFIRKDNGRYFGYVLITLGSSLGAAFANNLIALLIFWGILAATLYLLVNMQGTEKASASAKKSMIIIGGTDAFMIFGIGLIWKLSGTFAMNQIHLELSGALSCIAFMSIAIASFAKAGAVPFHSWLPDVAEDGPTPVTAYLPASLDKLLGIYLLARASLNLFAMNNISNTILLAVGSLTVIYAVMVALVQHDLKRLLGYHAVSQVGYMVIGIGTGNPIGIAGGLFHMLNHAIYKSCLFLSAGAVEKRANTTDLSKLGGLAKYMPITFICFLIASLSISGIPPFNGFVSKWMIYQGIIELGTAKNFMWILWLVCAMLGSVLTIASFLKLLHAVFLGRPSSGAAQAKEIGISMLLPIVVLAAICVVFGVFAFAIPIRLFIIPAIGAGLSYLGIWNSGMATALIMAGILLGFLIYIFLFPRRSRSVPSFIGGEDVTLFERVSGAEFYDTIKNIKVLDRFYKSEEKGSLDIYDQGKNAVSFLTKALQYLHNGVLPTYLVWCLLGMMGLFVFLFFR